MPEPLEVYRWLVGQGVPGDLARRGLRLARRAVIVRLEADRAEIIVPSQRRGVLEPVHAVSHLDLAALLKGSEVRQTVVAVGELPEDQQAYKVLVGRDGATCTCPISRLANAPLCVHRVAAAAVLYERGRLDLLQWLPEAARRYREWLRAWRARLARREEPRGAGGQLVPLTSYLHN